MSDLNKSLIKYGILLLTSPIWFPFLKAVWEEINLALRADGGLFGKLPSRRDRVELERTSSLDEDPLVNVPIRAPGEAAPMRKPADQGANGKPASGKRGDAKAGAGFRSADRTRPKGFR